jgi:hypothetical protein
MSNMKHTGDTSKFFSDEQYPARISAGKTLLPCHFRKVHYTVALFRTRLSATEKMLQGTRLKAALAWGSDRIVAVGLIKYSDSDLGAYDEVIISIPSIPMHGKVWFGNWLDMLGPLDKRKVGHFISHIPVTSEFSRAAGNELWGFPKIVTAISHRFQKNALESRLWDPEGRLIMECSGKTGFSIPSIPLSLLTYSRKNGRNLRTCVNVRGRMRLFPAQSLIIRVGDSGHPMAEDLRILGLHGKRPLLVMDSDRFQAVFREGKLTDDAWDQ